MWLNNFAEFERKQNSPNRLIMNFYSPDKGKSVKVYVPKKVRVPTKFLTSEKLQELKEKLAKIPILVNIPLETRASGKFTVASIEVPLDRAILNILSDEFQTGNYDRLLRFSGFYPERKVELSSDLEKLFETSDELELKDLEGMQFKNDFLTESEILSLPSLYIDIEKPLWKKDDERPLLEERDAILKSRKRYCSLKKRYDKNKLDEEKTKEFQSLRSNYLVQQKRLIELNNELTVDIPGAGKIQLYKKRFDADISSITTIWKDPNRKKEIREIYVLDPRGEVKVSKHDGYKILRFRNEERLVGALIKRLHERRPLISVGHNEVYDISQINYAALGHGMLFDPAIKYVKPRRDFVRNFIQRLREDMIYLDTLWIHRFMAPHLMQKSFGSNMKLASIAKFRKIDFSKSMTHADLRGEEVRRLVGETKEIRAAANEKMLKYAADDVTNTKAIYDVLAPIFLPLLAKMKDILPSSTYSELSFSTGCIKKVHEAKHFNRCGNLPYYGYKSKFREDEREIFKKRFSAMKRKRLEETADLKPIKGEHREVTECYFSLEEKLKDWAFRIEPKLKPVYEWAVEQSKTSEIGEEQLRGFLQYLKDFMKEPFTDYYFAKRDGRTYFGAKETLIKRIISHSEVPISSDDARSELIKNLIAIQREVPKTLMDQFLGSFRFLKNHFRSVYVALESSERGLIRADDNKISELFTPELFPQYQTNTNYAEIAEEDSDIYLLRKHSKVIQEKLNSSHQRIIKGFLSIFNRFEETSAEIQKIMKDKNISLQGSSHFDLLYAYLYHRRCEDDDRTFEPKYKASVKDVNTMMRNAYLDLARDIKQQGQLVDYRGDYLFITKKGDADLNIPCLHPVRHLEEYLVGEKENNQEKFELE